MSLTTSLSDLGFKDDINKTTFGFGNSLDTPDFAAFDPPPQADFNLPNQPQGPVFQIPDVHLNQQPAQADQASTPTSEPSQPAQSQPSAPGDGLSLNPQLPSISISMPDISIPDIVPGAPLPDMSAQISAVESALNIQPAVDAGVDLTQKTATPLIDAATGIVQPSVDMSKTVLNESIKAIQPVMQEAAKAATPIAELPHDVAQPIIDSIAQALPNHADIGISIPEMAKDAVLRQGDGSGYGEIRIGNTGAVADVSKTVDSIYNDVSKGTALEGISGADIFSVITNPDKFIAEKGKEVATNVLTSITGNAGVAGGFVQAVTSGDIGQGIRAVAQNVVADAIGLAAQALIPIPGAGFVVATVLKAVSCGGKSSAGEGNNIKGDTPWATDREGIIRQSVNSMAGNPNAKTTLTPEELKTIDDIKSGKLYAGDDPLMQELFRSKHPSGYGTFSDNQAYGVDRPGVKNNSYATMGDQFYASSEGNNKFDWSTFDPKRYT